MTIFPNLINKETKQALEKIKECYFIQNFYMAGGTGLAIQLGHRRSMDLDFFSEKQFEVERVKEELSSKGNFTVTSQNLRTLNGVLDGVKVSLFQYSYGRIYPLVDFEGIKLADMRDIAAMKMSAISSRGSKKDFVDLYFLLNKHSLKEIIGFFEKKYSNINYNKLHLLKSLTYFSDAEDEPEPEMLVTTSWEKIKEKISLETRRLMVIGKNGSSEISNWTD
jgi:predicted nucleotidyltransferase component of viral defense system